MEKPTPFRVTEQRKAILEALRSVTSHPTAEDVYAMVRKRLPRISLGTVYRNLVFLADEGVIQRLDAGGTVMRFDGNPETHHHVRCLACGRVDDIDGALHPEIPNGAHAAQGYEIRGYRLEYFGRCPDCRD